ncbi:unnamed protein product [Sphagnum jensenii]
MTIAYSGTAGQAGAKIIVSGNVTLAQLLTGRTDLFCNTQFVYGFNNVQLVLYGAGDFCHTYSGTTSTFNGLSVYGGGSGESFEADVSTVQRNVCQHIIKRTGISSVTINNENASFLGDIIFKGLNWSSATNWAFNFGANGVSNLYIINPNKPVGWSQYTVTTSSSTNTEGNLREQYTHDITTVNAAATGVVGVKLADFQSGSVAWSTTTSTGGVAATQYVTTATALQTSTVTNLSTTVSVAAYLYGYNTVVGSRTFSPTGSGITDSLLMVADVTTLSSSAVAALTSLSTLDNLYDASRYWQTLNTTNIQVPALGTNIITYSGTQLNLGSYNLVINSGTTTAGNAFAVSGSTITIYASTLAVGTKFTSFTTTGTVTLNSAVVNTTYTSSAGSQGSITLTGLQTLSSIYIATAQGGTQLANTALTGSNTSYTLYIAPNAGTSYYYKIAKYGYQPITGTFVPTQANTFAITQIPDTSVTQATVATVQAYTSLSSPDQFTITQLIMKQLLLGIVFTRLSSASGKNLSFGSNTIALNTAANGGSYISLLDNTSAQVQYIGPITGGTSTIYIAPGGALTYNYKIACYGYLSGTTSFTTQGYVTGTASLTADSGITQATAATVAAYTTLETPDKLYDYAAYIQTQNGTSGITIANPVTKNATQVSLGSNSLTLNTTASPIFSLSGGAITVKSTATFAKGRSGTICWTDYNRFYYDLYCANLQQHFLIAIKSLCYGYLSATTSFNTQGYVNGTASLTADSGITQTVAATTAAYTTLETPDKLYDYAAYIQTQNGTSGITIANPLTKNGTQVSLGSNSLTLNTTASPIFAFSAGAVTVKSTATFATGTSFTSIGTSSTITVTGVTITCVYTTSAGTSTVLAISNLPYTAANGGSYISLLDNTSTQVQYVGPITTGSTTRSILHQEHRSPTAIKLLVTVIYLQLPPLRRKVTQLEQLHLRQIANYSSAIFNTTAALNLLDFWNHHHTANTGATFTVGTTFTSIATTSTITTNGVTLSTVYSTSSGTSTSLVITNLPYTAANGGSYISIIDNTSTQVQYVGPITSGTATITIAPGASLPFSYKIACYGYLSTTTAFTTQGYVTGTAALATDTGITQGTVATVAAYTTLGTADKLYDYAAYIQTQNVASGIKITNPVTKNATQVSFGTDSVTFNTVASPDFLSFWNGYYCQHGCYLCHWYYLYQYRNFKQYHDFKRNHYLRL